MTPTPSTPNQVDAVDDLLKAYQANMLLAERKLKKNEWNIGQAEGQEQAATQEAKAKLNALLVTARLDELKLAKNRKQIFGYYDERINQLEKQRETV